MNSTGLAKLGFTNSLCLSVVFLAKLIQFVSAGDIFYSLIMGLAVAIAVRDTIIFYVNARKKEKEEDAGKN
jgi:hypothetical protein